MRGLRGRARRLVRALRYHNVYGPRMPRNTPYAGWPASSARRPSAARRRGCSRTAASGATSSTSRDVAAANVLALEAAPEVVGAFNVATGEPHTVLEMAIALADAIGRATTSRPRSSAARPGDVRHVVASPQRAEACLGFRAEVGFAEGMRQFAVDPLRT